MKQYQLTAAGTYRIGGITIPDDIRNADYQRMMTEVDSGLAEILPVPPAPSPPSDEQQIAEWLVQNKWAAALVRGINRLPADERHIPVGGNLSNANLIAKIKANKDA